PTRLQAINSNIESVVFDLESYNLILNEFLAYEENAKGQKTTLDSSSNEIEAHNERIKILQQLENLSNRTLVSTMRAHYDGDPDDFLHASESITLAKQLLIQLERTAVDAKPKEMLSRLNSLLKDSEEAIKSLQQIMAAATEDTLQRNTLADNAIKNASALRAAGDLQAQQAAIDSTLVLGRVILSLGVGVLVVLLISTLMTYLITRSITRPINRLIAKLSDGAMEVDKAAAELSQSSANLALGAKDSTSSLSDVSLALDDLSTTTQRNADGSIEANTLMNQVTEAVAQADKSMQKVIKAMGEISSSGNAIAKIIKAIDEIAFQTNLLALNAAVEAARAGEAGAGFAVVADEVRNLATRSADAAKSTADLIASTISNINSGSEMVTTAAQNFNSVEDHAHKVAGLLGQVAEASKNQAQGIDQISQSMGNMENITKSNVSSADQSAGAAATLSSLAAGLLTAVDDLSSLVHGQQHNPQHGDFNDRD
ncbi:MAG: methyl-accepting chemotaxis protein, partial [Candidatus Adiutrix sp.]